MGDQIRIPRVVITFFSFFSPSLLRRAELSSLCNVVFFPIYQLFVPHFAMAVLCLYYMASSVSGQDEPSATRAGKMEPSCPLGTTRCIPQAKFHQKPYNKSFIDQVCSVKMAGYWPRSFFASLWTSTSPRSINKQKKNLANIQPS